MRAYYLCIELRNGLRYDLPLEMENA